MQIKVDAPPGMRLENLIRFGSGRLHSVDCMPKLFSLRVVLAKVYALARIVGEG